MYNVIYSCDGKAETAITPVFSVKWSFRNNSNNHFLLSKLRKVVFVLLYIFVKIVMIFFRIYLKWELLSLLNKIINFYKKK